MGSKFYTLVRALIVVIFGYVLINSFFIAHSRTVRNDIIQGILLGAGMGFVMLPVIARFYVTKVNSWITIFGCGEPGRGMLFRAACAQIFPGPVNVPEEAMYWWTNSDGTGRSLNGRNAYVLRFPPGGLPPNDAFWSLTMGSANNRFVPNPINRYSVSDRSGLAENADGSVDVYIQNTAPAGHESNWLPSPAGNFILWLRVYLPGEAILNREYVVPPVVKTEG